MANEELPESLIKNKVHRHILYCVNAAFLKSVAC